jgi:hypothetical protein
MEKKWANISALSPQHLAKNTADDIAKSFSKLSLEPVFFFLFLSLPPLLQQASALAFDLRVKTY